ncbi:hypothetical protein MRX96_028667 [Rhipicephalus microplus]
MLAVDGASIAPAHKTVISAGRIVIYFEEEKKGGTCERRESEREELHRWPGLRNQLWIQMATLRRKLTHPNGVVATPVSPASLQQSSNHAKTKGAFRLPQPVP